MKTLAALLLLLTLVSCQREPTLEELQRELIEKLYENKALQERHIQLLEATVKERDSDLKELMEAMQQHLKEQH